MKEKVRQPFPIVEREDDLAGIEEIDRNPVGFMAMLLA
jgi:hypothetical protein